MKPAEPAQFDAVEPENRLVAGGLEARWNHALEQVAALETRIAAMGERSASLNGEQKSELMALGDDVQTLWCITRTRLCS